MLSCKKEYDERNGEATWLSYETIKKPPCAQTDQKTDSVRKSEQLYFGSSDRIPQGEGLLVDTGAKNNLVGDGWVRRMNALNQKAGRPTSTAHDLGYTVTLGGVGKNSQRSDTYVNVPTEVAGQPSKFSATVIQNSDLPALLGLKSLQEKNAVLDVRNNRLLLSKSPNAVKVYYQEDQVKVIDLVQAPGGYLMIPCSPTCNKP